MNVVNANESLQSRKHKRDDDVGTMPKDEKILDDKMNNKKKFKITLKSEIKTAVAEKPVVDSKVIRCSHDGQFHHLTYRHFCFHESSNHSCMMPWQKQSVDETIKSLGLTPKSFIDLCSNVGVELINYALIFVKTLERITSIEVEPSIIPLLKENITTFGVGNVTVLHANFLEIFTQESKTTYDLGYLDLPFTGGKNYRNKEYRNEDAYTVLNGKTRLLVSDILPILLKQIEVLVVKLPITYRFDLHMPRVSKNQCYQIQARAGRNTKPAYWLVVLTHGFLPRTSALVRIGFVQSSVEKKASD